MAFLKWNVTRDLISLNDPVSVRERERFSLGSVSGLKSTGRDRLGNETTGIFFFIFFFFFFFFKRLRFFRDLKLEFHCLVQHTVV